MSDESIDRFVEILRATRAELDPSRAALLVIDMQRCQIRRDSAACELLSRASPGLLDYFAERVEALVEPNVVRLLAAARAIELPVVFTLLASHDREGRDLPRQLRSWNDMARAADGRAPIPHKDDPEAQVVESLAPRDGELVIPKTTSGVFTGTPLEHLLKNMGIEQIIVCGVLTNLCVEGTARGGAELGFDVFVVDDACAAWSESVHRASLRSLEMVFTRLVTADEVARRLED